MDRTDGFYFPRHQHPRQSRLPHACRQDHRARMTTTPMSAATASMEPWGVSFLVQIHRMASVSFKWVQLGHLTNPCRKGDLEGSLSHIIRLACPFWKFLFWIHLRTRPVMLYYSC